jgi:hypothetical protein
MLCQMTKAANGIIIVLSTNLLVKMFSKSRAVGRGGREREVKYFYLKAEDGIVTGYETDITRSVDNKNTTIHFN